MRLRGSAKKFHEHATAQGWVVSVTHKDVIIIAIQWPPGMVPPPGWYTAITARFTTAGGYLDATGSVVRRKSGGGVQITDGAYSLRKRTATEIANLPSHGPVAAKIDEESKHHAEAQAKEARAQRRAALDEAAKIDAIQQMVRQTKRDRDRTAFELRSTLEALISTARKQLDALDQGVTPPHSDLARYGSAAQRLTAALRVLQESYNRQAEMFGRVKDTWDLWPNADRRPEASLAAREATK